LSTTTDPQDAESAVDILHAGGSVAPDRHRVSRSLTSAAVYSLGFAVQRAIGLVMLPFYTRAISPSQYGALGILLSLYIVVGVLFSAGLETSIVRNYFQLAAEPERRQEYIDSVWRFLALYPLIASLLLAVGVWPFLGSSHYISGSDVLLMLLASALNTAGSTLPLAVLRARQDLRGYLWMTAVTAFGTPALTIIFVVFLHQGIRGWFLAAAIVNFAAFGAAMIIVPWRPRAHFNRRVVGAALLFSLPLIPHFISSWALQLADRLVISGIVTAGQLGIYSLASNLASPILMLVMALNQGFIPIYAKAGAKAGHERELSTVVMLQITAVVGLTLAGATLGASAVLVLTPPSYHSAAPLVPWIVLGYGFLGVYFVPMNGATLGAGRRNFAWVASASSAATNIALLLIYVPSDGVYAAAVASAIGYFVLLLLMAIWAHARHNPVSYDWYRISQAVVLGLLAYVGATLTAPRSPAGTIVVQIGWLFAFAFAIAMLRFRSQLAMRLRSAVRV
jgi:O-antigen/teichoic acid export membrane protein